MYVNLIFFKHVVGVQKGYHVIKYLVSYVHTKITLYTLHCMISLALGLFIGRAFGWWWPWFNPHLGSDLLFTNFNHHQLYHCSILSDHHQTSIGNEEFRLFILLKFRTVYQDTCCNKFRCQSFGLCISCRRSRRRSTRDCEYVVKESQTNPKTGLCSLANLNSKQSPIWTVYYMTVTLAVKLGTVIYLELWKKASKT